MTATGVPVIGPLPRPTSRCVTPIVNPLNIDTSMHVLHGRVDQYRDDHLSYTPTVPLSLLLLSLRMLNSRILPLPGGRLDYHIELGPSSNKKLFPVQRPGGLKRAYGTFFLFCFFFFFTPPPLYILVYKK